MALPRYFNCGRTDDEFYHSVGDRVYGTLVIKGVEAKYRFNDGSRPYEEIKRFGSIEQAEKFAARFAAEMNRCIKKNAVPMLSTFRSFD